MSQALQPHFNKLMTTLDEAHSYLRVYHNKIVNIKDRALELEKPNLSTERYSQIQREINIDLSEIEKFSDKVTEELKKVKKTGNTFRSRLELLIFYAPESATEAEIFAKQFQNVFEEMLSQSQRTKEEYGNFKQIMARQNSAQL